MIFSLKHGKIKEANEVYSAEKHLPIVFPYLSLNWFYKINVKLNFLPVKKKSIITDFFTPENHLLLPSEQILIRQESP